MAGRAAGAATAPGAATDPPTPAGAGAADAPTPSATVATRVAIPAAVVTGSRFTAAEYGRSPTREKAKIGAGQPAKPTAIFRADRSAHSAHGFIEASKRSSMDKVLVIVPTYDERPNVQPIARAVLQACPAAHLLFVDDNSPDGTGALLDQMAAEDPRIHVLHRPGKSGLGRAYIAGFKWALERDFALIFEMDADFSHDPAELPNFLKAAEDADLVIGSRYIGGIRIINWPLSRLMLSKGAATYVRLITGMPVTDPTGGYKCYRREVLAAMELDRVISNGYSFQVEMTHGAWMRGFRIVEVPIVFEDRRSGYSKMSRAIMREALWMVWRLALSNGFRRSPRVPVHPASRAAGAPTRPTAPSV
jgi:dolichol-phosphate mannosyltransferase